jgi:diguanylate cyclase (GGDEF)-like protein
VSIILVAERNDATRRDLVELGLEQGVEIVAARNGAEALARARATALDGAILDIGLSSPMSAFALAHELRALPEKARLPIAFAADDGDLTHRVAAAHAGAQLYLAKPIDAYAFGDAVARLVALGRDDRARVLVVDDDADFAGLVAEILESHGIGAIVATDPARILELLDAEAPDLVLLDVMLPGVGGFDLARTLRTTQRWQDVPILFLTARADREARLAAFDAGGDDYLLKPVLEEELLARVRVRLDRRRLAREMTERDPLTRLLSRRALLEALAARVSEARRHGLRLSLAVLDVDGFKQVNDRRGHAVGDHVLATIGHRLNERFRLEDVRGRLGGDELVIAFPGEAPDTAAAVLRRVLDEVAAIRFGSGGSFRVTMSAGIASYPEDGATVEALLKTADARLYAAKRAPKGGGARVVVAGAADTNVHGLPFTAG